MPELHVIFGSGQVGTPLATRLLADGKQVRVVRKSAGAVAAGAETRRGDALDARFCAEATAGASVVYHCMNPAYSTSLWAEQVPRYMESLIAAAGKAGARLVVLDNLYMLGRPAGRPLSEESPVNPCSRKGEIRARTAERLFEAHRKGEVRAVGGRASDFYGPGGGQTYLGDYFWKPAQKGTTAWSPVDPGRRPHVPLHPGRRGRPRPSRIRARRRARTRVDAPLPPRGVAQGSRRPPRAASRPPDQARAGAAASSFGAFARRAARPRASGDGVPVGRAVRRGRPPLPRAIRPCASRRGRRGPGDRGVGEGGIHGLTAPLPKTPGHSSVIERPLRRSANGAGVGRRARAERKRKKKMSRGAMGIAGSHRAHRPGSRPLNPVP